MSSRLIRVMLLLGVFVASLVLFLGVILIVSGRNTTPIATINPSTSVGGPFKLVNQNGQPITEKDFLGKPTMVFFGFTHCPDICPATLFEVSEVLRAMGDDSGKVNALFVTVDPERDTPAAMKDYLTSFDPKLVGATGDADAVRAIEKAYRVYSRKVPTDGGGYTMDHTAIVYLMDKDGRFVRPFDVKRKPQDVAADLRRYL